MVEKLMLHNLNGVNKLHCLQNENYVQPLLHPNLRLTYSFTLTLLKVIELAQIFLLYIPGTVIDVILQYMHHSHKIIVYVIVMVLKNHFLIRKETYRDKYQPNF